MVSTGGKEIKTGQPPDTLLTDLEEAWQDREREAANLKAAGHEMMALVLRLYVVEIKLKTLICRTLKLEQLPSDCKTHGLNRLIIFTGLFAELNEPANLALKKNWDVLAFFSNNGLNELRYLPANHALQPGLAKFDEMLDDPINGVWTWLSKRP